LRFVDYDRAQNPARKTTGETKASRQKRAVATMELQRKMEA
jgi:hypothetical protein